MAYSLTNQLDKVEHDMLKAGYPASAVYLAMHNECKKFMEQERAEHYFKLYQQHYQNEKEAKLKNDQQQLSYNAASVVNHFPPETANQNAIKFVESQPNYYACVENHKQMTDHMIANGIAPTVDGFRKAYYTLRALGVLKSHPNHEPEAYYGKGLAASLGGAMAVGAQQAIGKVPHMDTALAQQQAQAHMLAQMAQEEKIKRDIIRAAMEIDTWVNKDSMKEKIKSAVVTEHVGRKFREDI
jgi:uncharacterized protein YdaT